MISGGKRGVEIEGAADMGGLAFFCTKVDEPEGDVELLIVSVEAMNAQSDPNDDEERKGCSGHIGKMVFSCSETKLAVVAYVPLEMAEKLSAKEWLDNIMKLYDGVFVSGNDTLAAGGTFNLTFIEF